MLVFHLFMRFHMLFCNGSLVTAVKLESKYRRVSFYARVTFMKTVMQIEHKIPIKAACFLGCRGLAASSYIVYDYTTSGYMDL